MTIDTEFGELSSDLLTSGPALSYLRYDAVLEPQALEDLGLPELISKVTSLRKMERAENRFDLAKIGERAAERQIKDSHFPAGFDPK